MSEETENVKDFLENRYDAAMIAASGQSGVKCVLNENTVQKIDIVVNYAEGSKGVLTVLLTSLVYKSLHPEQDVRLHQTSIKGGYSGRTFDTKYITPFMKEKRFPAMGESGWLTRSLEQKSPYTFDYKGAITPAKLKAAFLEIMDYINKPDADVVAVLSYLLQSLIIMRDKNNVDLAVPRNLSIEGIMTLLERHFHHHYKAKGASRLPVIVLYAMYQCLFDDGVKRFKDKRLLPLESHTSADVRSGRLGDIDVVNTDGRPFEAVEIKFDIPVSHEIVVTAKEKIQPTTVERYYILSTKPALDEDKDKIASDIRQIKNIHGCQLVVNGVMPTLRYYMRLLDNPVMFINRYVALLKTDKAVKFEHKQGWNDLVSKL